MGAAPSREAQACQLEELLGTRPRPWRVDRRRKEVSLLPLTTAFMHYVKPTAASPVDACAVSRQGSGSSHSDSSGSRTSGSARRNRSLAQPCLDAAPASLPFVQQLYDAYREPSTQFYCRKEAWGHMDALPPELYYTTIEAFYDATVGCYEDYLFETNDDMQHAFDQQQLARRLQSYNRNQKGAEPARRPKKLSTTAGPQLRPIPCAICFEYPTSTVAHAPSGGPGTGYGGAAPPRGTGAPFGSVVLSPSSSFMAIGFIGLVPVRRQKRAASAETFLRPPADSAGDDGEIADGRGGSGATGEPAEYELVAFISKSAGEQHLARALFQAAFLYLDQCRRAGLPGNPPLPAVRFSCFLTDVPSLCFLREVRQRCAEFGWRRRLARALRRLRLAAQHLAVEMDGTVATELGAFLGAHFVRLECHPAPAAPPCYFGGFVGDAGSAAPGSGEAGARAALQPAPLPTASSAAVMAVLQARADTDRIAARGTGGGAHARGAKRDAAPAESPNAPVRLICVVGTSRLTVGGVVYPHGTALARYVDPRTGAFVGLHWSVAKDLLRHDRLPTDFYEADPEDAHDFSVCVRDAADAAPEPTLAVSDVILSWSKDLYVQARVAKRTDQRWGHAYPLDFYTAPRSTTAARAQSPTATPPHPSTAEAQERRVRTSPLTAANVKAFTRAATGDTNDAADAAASDAFHLWTFEHQGRSYTLGLVPNFVRAQQQELQQWQRRCGNAVPRRAAAAAPTAAAATIHKPELNTEPARRAETVDDVVECALELASDADGASSGTSQQLDTSHSGGSGRSVRSGDTYRTAASSHSTMSQLMGFRRSAKQRRVFLSLGTGQVYENGAPVSNLLGPASSSRHSRCTSEGGSSAASSGFHADPATTVAAAHDAGAGVGGARAGTAGAAPIHHRSPVNAMGYGEFGGGECGGGAATPNASTAARGGPAGPSPAAAAVPPPSSLRRHVHEPYAMGDHQLLLLQPTAPVLQRRLSGGVSRGSAGHTTAETPSPKADSTHHSRGDTANGLSGAGDVQRSTGCASLHGFGMGGYMDGLVDYAYGVGGEEPHRPAVAMPTSFEACAPPTWRVREQPYPHHPPQQQPTQQQQQMSPLEPRWQPRSDGKRLAAPSHALSVTRVGCGFPAQPLVFPHTPAPPTQPRQPPAGLHSAGQVEEVKAGNGQTRLRGDWRDPGQR